MLVFKEEVQVLIGKTWLKTSKSFWPNAKMIISISKDNLSVTCKILLQLMFGRSLRTVLHLVLPSKPKIQKPLHKYNLHEFVFVKNYGKREKWIKGKIIKLRGSGWVIVERCDGIMCQRHVNQ